MRIEHPEFLPAVLEIQESPPLPASRFILWMIMLFFLVSIVWASVGEIDIVGVAQGRIVPGGRVKVIQPLETGEVREIYIREGQNVNAGDPLIELDTTLTGADSDRIREQLLVLRLDRIRLKTLMTKIQTLENRRQSKEHGKQETDNGDFSDRTTFRSNNYRL